MERLRIENQVHLTDLFSRIDHILICQDATTIPLAIEASETADNDWEDMDKEQYWLLQSDSYLNELTETELKSIRNLQLLERIAKLDPRKLTREQTDRLTEELGKKVILDRVDVEKIINALQQCVSISYERRHPKTNRFLKDRSGNLRLDECLDIIHQLTIEDYVASSRSFNPNHIGNNLIIFEPTAKWETSDGTVFENLVIYVKLDIDSSDESAVALISMHEAEYADRHPYQN